MRKPRKTPRVVAVDVFCGAGGLTYGLRKAGVSVVCGVDLDPACEYPYSSNNRVPFKCEDVAKLKGRSLAKLFPRGAIRLLAGCAPCRPFSPLRRGADNSRDEEWTLLDEFTRLVRELKPELVTMENVPDVASKPVFRRLLATLDHLGYNYDYDSVYCPPLGIPQHRRRLVLVASLIGEANVPSGVLAEDNFKSVRRSIGSLPAVAAGDSHPSDRLHRARSATPKNMRRLKASKPGGTWREWPKDLRAKCHQRRSGATYKNVYARMAWDEPAPTITTLAYSFGSGRFGHPEQHRSLTLREAALLQTFPRRYRFVQPRERVYFTHVGRMIGNAVPPTLGRAIGRELLRIARKHAESKRVEHVRSKVAR